MFESNALHSWFASYSVLFNRIVSLSTKHEWNVTANCDYTIGKSHNICLLKRTIHVDDIISGGRDIEVMLRGMWVLLEFFVRGSWWNLAQKQIGVGNSCEMKSFGIWCLVSNETTSWFIVSNLPSNLLAELHYHRNKLHASHCFTVFN